MIFNITNNFKKYTYLLSQLVIRDFKTKYKRSILGILWSLLNPLLTMVVMTLVFSKVFKFDIPLYPVYLISGLIFFNYFSEATTLGMSSVVVNFSLITKVYIPKYIFPLSKCLFVGINFLLTLIPMYIIAFAYGVRPTWVHLLLPYVFICIFFFTLGVSFIMSALSVFLRDMFYIYGIITMICMYLTPIMYPLKALPEQMITFMKFNPLYQFISFARKIILDHEVPSANTFIACAVAGLVSFLVGAIFFKKTQDKFIYYI